jgi:hypothetical protein
MSVAAGHGVSVRIEACGKTFTDGTRALEPATLDIARGETLGGVDSKDSHLDGSMIQGCFWGRQSWV